VVSAQVVWRAGRDGAVLAGRKLQGTGIMARKAAKRDKGLPERIFAQASPHSQGGVSMFDAGSAIDSTTVANFHSEDDLITRAALRLKDAGFEVLQISQSTINIAGSPKLYEDAFGSPLVTEERPAIRDGKESTSTVIDSPSSELPGLISIAGSRFEDVLEGVAIEEPVYLDAPRAWPPRVPYWCLDVPAGVSLGCRADRAHRSPVTGRGVRVAMVDTGQYAHPFFAERGYRVAPTVLGPGTADPNDDEVGHGTGESANIFACAPDCELLPVKASTFVSGAFRLVNTTAAFNAAVGLGPDIITNSWSRDIRNPPLTAADQVLAAAVADAVAAGIIVVFSAGNGRFGFPGQHPDVISAGGVFMDIDGSLQASNYASGFVSNIYPGRNSPDLCGLVGMLPRAIYIMLPLQEGCEIDQGNGGGTHPNGDQTAGDDGWAGFSGTSAAAPQLAGVAALIKEACPRLTPAQVRDIMRATARDVTQGSSHPNTGGTAGPGFDTATGAGLVDAHRAVLMAKLRCQLQPIRPPIRPPIEPVQPIRPPIQPVQPIRPPIEPVQPIRPPIQPISPVRPSPLSREDAPPPAEPTGREGAPITPEDVKHIEEMLRRGELDDSGL
jgi:hypothetical protein